MNTSPLRVDSFALHFIIAYVHLLSIVHLILSIPPKYQFPLPNTTKKNIIYIHSST